MPSVIEIPAYRHFAAVALKEPIDWYQNPYASANWVHYFLSLRWLHDLEGEALPWVMSDFFRWMDEDSEARDYLGGRKRDHTSAIRLGVYFDLLVSGEERLDRERLKAEIVRLVEELGKADIYSLGHNHGLLTDEAVLRIASRDRWRLIDDAQIERVLARISEQIEALFDSDGYTLEHSISYQEYNLMTLHRIGCLLEESGTTGVQGIIHRIRRIREASRRLLGNALRGNGEYIPFGDSFRRPKKRILRTVFGVDDPLEMLRSAASPSSMFVAGAAGFGFYRDPDWHFGVTASNNLGSHKQQDELSIFVEFRGRTLVDDAGYSDTLDGLKAEVRTRKAHSTFRLLGKDGEIDFLTRRLPQARWVNAFSTGGLTGFISHAELRSGGNAWRLIGLLKGAGVLVVDWCKSIRDLERTVHRFVLGLEPEKCGTDAGEAAAVDLGGGCCLVPLNGEAASGNGVLNVVGRDVSRPEPRCWIEWQGELDQPRGFLLTPNKCASPAVTVRLEEDELLIHTPSGAGYPGILRIRTGTGS